MAIVLRVHIVETIWSRRKDTGGLLAPFLVVDHNGQQQQTEVVRAGAVTAWNQKASFPYVPTSDLVIMAFDAGRHQPGVYVGQCVVDVASMLQAGSLTATAPLISSTGGTLGHVVFDVELSTSSRAIAAGLDIPGLTLIQQQQSGRSPSSRVTSPRRAIFQEDHLSAGMGSSFALPGLHCRVQQPGGLGGQAGASAEPDTPTRLSHRLVETFGHGLGTILGLNLKRRSVEEPPGPSGLLGLAANAPSTPAAVAAAPIQGPDSPSEAAGALVSGLMLSRRNLMRSSNSFGSPSAPLMPAALAASWSAGAVAAAAAGAAAAEGGVAAAEGMLAAGARGGQAAAGGRQHQRYSRASDSSSMFSSEAAVRLSQDGSGGGWGAAAPGGGETLSPLRSSRTKLRLSRSKHMLQQQQRLKLQQQLEQQEQQRQQQEMMMQLEAAIAAAVRAADGRAGSERPSDDAESDVGAQIDEQLLREYEAADAAGKEAILYRQLMLQQAEKRAGTAQLLNLLALQQQQEKAHNTQLLATLAALSPTPSPRHPRLQKQHTGVAAAAAEDGGFSRLADTADPDVAAAVAAAAAVAHQAGSGRVGSPRSRHYPDIAGVISLCPSPNSQELAGGLEPDTPGSSCAPEFASPNMSFRTSCASSAAPTPLPIGAGARHGSSSSSENGALPAVPVRVGSSGKNKYYPEVPKPVTAADGEKPTKARNRKQWSISRAAAAAASGVALGAASSTEDWHSCDGNNAAAAAVDGAADPDADATAAGGNNRKSRFKKAAAGRGQAARQVRSYPLSCTDLDSELDAEASITAGDVLPAYTCNKAAGADAPYCYVRNSQGSADKGGRWCMHSMLDAVPYERPAAAFPEHAVAVQPSAPLV